MKQGFRNAFCATRPPGHHSGIFGKTFHNDDKDKACSNGFCFLNNVAIAAAYAKCQYREEIKKVAIVDFDVHHGNGTQEIVEAAIEPKEFRVPVAASTFSVGEMTHKKYMPWFDSNDGENILFTSVHLFNNNEHQYNSESSGLYGS